MSRSKFVIGILGGVISLAMILSIVILPAVPVSANSSVDIVIVPTPYTATVNETFTVDIRLVAGSVPVRGAEVHLDFSTTYLEVQNITPGGALDIIFQNKYNNTAGTIDYSAGKLGAELSSGNITLATVQLKAKAAIASTPLTFVSNIIDNRKTDVVTSPTASVLGTVTPGSVEIVTATMLLGHVNLQGRLNPPDNSWVTNLTVTLFLANIATPVATYNVTTDNTGNFSSINLGGVPLGTYDIRVKGLHTLSNLVEDVVITSGATTGPIDFGTLLEGDCDDNNMINISDFGLLADAFGTIPGNPAWDARCDFNVDGMVNIVDFGLLADNFGLMGA